MRSTALIFLLCAFTLPARSEPKPIVGVYYFDGWADDTSANFHVKDMPKAYPDREPLSGWYDNTPAIFHQQIEWARSAGIDFFLFDWYETSRDGNSSDKTLNSALNLYRADKRKLGLKYALLYVNNGAFNIPRSDWDMWCTRWVGDYLRQPAYFRVQGKPLVVVYSAPDLEQEFGGTAGSREALDRLRAAARKAGLPGVFVVACATPGPKNGWTNLDHLAISGYDALTGYNYPGVAGTHNGANPYSTLVKGSVEIWDDFARDGRLPYIPVVTDGWDSRPWNETPYWYERTPKEVGDFVGAAIRWSRNHPKMQVTGQAPLVLVEAWNELGEGSYIVPTKASGHKYVDALARSKR